MSLEEFWGMQATLDEAPADWATRLVLADWYEEAGRPSHALTQRWLVEHRKHPMNNYPRTGASLWMWFNGLGSTGIWHPACVGDLTALLPRHTVRQHRPQDRMDGYEARLLAENALAVALVRCAGERVVIPADREDLVKLTIHIPWEFATEGGGQLACPI